MKLGERLFDLLFLFRYGFVYAYLFVAAVYAAILLAMPYGQPRALLAVSLVYSDISMLGFMFMGASLHLERESGILDVLGIVPVSAGSLVRSRAVAMASLSTGIGLILIISGVGFHFNPLLFIAGTFVCGATYSLFGISLAARTANLARYVLLAGLLTLPAGLPLLGFLRFVEHPLFMLLPGAGGLGLLGSAARTGLSPLTISGAAVSVLNSAAWLLIAYTGAASSLRRRLMERRGAGG